MGFIAASLVTAAESLSLTKHSTFLDEGLLEILDLDDNSPSWIQDFSIDRMIEKKLADSPLKEFLLKRSLVLLC